MKTEDREMRRAVGFGLLTAVVLGLSLALHLSGGTGHSGQSKTAPSGDDWGIRLSCRWSGTAAAGSGLMNREAKGSSSSQRVPEGEWIG